MFCCLVSCTMPFLYSTLIISFRYPDICPPPPEENNKQRLRFNNITSIVIKSIYKDVKDEM